MLGAEFAARKNFPCAGSKIQAALKNLPGGTAGPLPVLDGFVLPGTRKLDAYQRPYYQCSVRITPAASGGSLVRVVAKITAWDSDPAHSGYEVLQSNGRLESDLLDRLQERLAGNSNSESAKSANSSTAPSNAGTPQAHASPAPDISAPMPQFRSPSGMGLSSDAATKDNQDPALQQEAQGLEDLVRNQSHPTDLVAVKENQTPVLQDPSADAKVLFLASAEDEFEVLDKNPEWVHVRISGLSRGWLRRTGVEMLDGSEKRQGLDCSFVRASHRVQAIAVFIVVFYQQRGRGKFSRRLGPAERQKREDRFHSAGDGYRQDHQPAG